MTDDNVIFSYSTDQAIEDGVLVHPFPDKFRYLLLSAAVFADIEQKIEDTERTLAQAIIPLMDDAIMLMRAARQKDPDEYMVTEGLEGNITGKTLWVAMNEVGGLTIMYPEDN